MTEDKRMRTLHLGRHQREREGSDEDGEEDVDDLARVGVALVDERGAKVEGERVRRVDDEEEARETAAVPERGLVIDVERLGDGDVVETREAVLSAERLSCADGRDDLLRERAALGDKRERLPERASISL